MAVLATTKVEGATTLPVKMKVVLGVGTDKVVGTRIRVPDVVVVGMGVDDDVNFLVVEGRIRVEERVAVDEEKEEVSASSEEDEVAEVAVWDVKVEESEAEGEERSESEEEAGCRREGSESRVVVTLSALNTVVTLVTLEVTVTWRLSKGRTMLRF